MKPELIRTFETLSSATAPVVEAARLDAKKSIPPVLASGDELRALVVAARVERAALVGELIGTGAAAVYRAVAGIAARLQAAMRQRAATAELRGLDDRMLSDIGVERRDIEWAVRSGPSGRQPSVGADHLGGIASIQVGLGRAA